MSGGSRTVLRSVLRVLASFIVNGLLGVAFVPIAFRRLGEEGYGALSVYWFVIGYLALAELGVGKNLVRELASAPGQLERRAYYQRSLSAYMMIAFAVAIISPLLAWTVPRWVIPFGAGMRAQVGILVLLAVADYILGITVSLHTAEAVASERFAQYAWFQSISGLLRYGGGIAVLVLVPSPTPALVGAAFVGRRLFEIPLAVVTLGHLPEGTLTTWRPTLRVRKTFARSSTLSVAQLLQTSITSASSVLIGHSSGPAALGLLRACFDLASKLWFVSNALGLVLFPRFARLQASDAGRQILAAFLPAALTVSAALITFLGILGALFASPLLVALGTGGGLAWAIFALSLGGVALHAQANVPYELIQANGRFREAAVIAAHTLAALLATFFLLRGIPPLLGVGWAWFASQALYALRCRQAVAHLLSDPQSRRAKAWTDEALATLALAASCFAVLTTSTPARIAWSIGSILILALMMTRAFAKLPLLIATI